MSETRRARSGVWDRYSASDPGLLRLMAGLRTVGSIGLALLVLRLLGIGVTQLVAGAMAAMVSTFAIRDKQVRDQAVTLTLGLPIALVSVSLGALLGPETPERTLDRLRQAFRARTAQLLATQVELVAAGPDELEDAVADLRKD